MVTSPYAMLAVVIACFIGSFGPIYIKKGTADLEISFALLKNWRLMLGVFCYGLSAAIIVPALKFGEVSVLYPIVSTSYIWVSLLSVKMLGEHMNWKKWAGISLIIVGVLSLALA